MEYSVGKNLKKLREKIGKTQGEMAGALGVSESTYRGYERESKQHNVQTIIKICSVFKISADYLLFGTERQSESKSGTFEMKIYKEEDRVAVAGILNKNGYATCFIKRKKMPNGKAVEYLVRAKESSDGEGLNEVAD